jgi:hypothetical protein
MSERTYGLMIGRTARCDSADVRPPVQMYGQSVIRKPYFHQPSHSSCLLVIELFFSINRTDDRSFLSIQVYGASRELHGGVLRPG